MPPVPAPALLYAFRLLLPLAACGLAHTFDSPTLPHHDEVVHLFTFGPNKGLHLQIYPNGRVNGAPRQSLNSAVMLKTDHKGFLKIIGVYSGLFLCMRRNGNLYGARSFNNNCLFTYHRLYNHYDIYVSVKHKLLVSLGTPKGPFIPNKSPPPYSHFLPRSNKLPVSLFDM